MRRGISGLVALIIALGATMAVGAADPFTIPWDLDGLNPSGQYYNNLDEHVSPSSGLLVVYQTDVSAPGAELDLKVARVFRTPTVLRAGTPYKMPVSPYANLGTGWSLDLPWVDFNNVYWWRGQVVPHSLRYETGGTHVNHKDIHFTLEQHIRGDGGPDPSFFVDYWILTTADGVQYRFDELGNLEWILTPNGNKMTFSYSTYVSGYDDEGFALYVTRLTSITDSIGRHVGLHHSSDGSKLEFIAVSGPGSTPVRKINYRYNAGGRLAYVDDPLGSSGASEGHTSAFTYSGATLTSITYPTGGRSTYTYDSISKYFNDDDGGATYSRYRVKTHKRFVKGSVSSYGDYYRKFAYTMSTTDWARITSTTVETMEQPSDPEVKKREVFQANDKSLVTQSSIIDPVSSKELARAAFAYDGNNQLITKTDTRISGTNSVNVTTQYTYDTWGNVIAQKDPLGHWTYTAYANGNGAGQNSGTWSGGAFYSNSIQGDIKNRPIGSYYYQDEPVNGVQVLKSEIYNAYDSKGNLVEVKKKLDSGGTVTWLKERNEYATSTGGVTYGPTRVIRGYHLAQTDQRMSTDITLDSYAFPSSWTTTVEAVTDGLTRETTTSVPVTVSLAYLKETGRVATKTDGNGNVTTYKYDLLGRPSRTIYPSTATGRMTAVAEYPVVDDDTYLVTSVGTFDEATQSVQNQQQYRRYKLDGLGRLSTTEVYASVADYPTTPQSVETVTYDWQGKVSSVTKTRSKTAYPYDYQVTFEYDLLGRPTKEIRFDGTRITAYDDAADWDSTVGIDGWTKTVTDERGHQTRFCYDWLDRLRRVDGYGVVTVTTSYAYDAASNLKAVTNGRGATTSYDYDLLNRPVVVTYPPNQAGAITATKQTYDDFGRIATKTDQKQQVVSFGYDKLNRLVSRSEKSSPQVADFVTVATYEYDRAGNQVHASDEATEIWRVPDALNRIASEETIVGGKTFQVSHAFNAGGLEESVEAPNHKLSTMSYDAAGRLARIQRGTGEFAPILATYYAYHPLGLPSQITWGNDTVTYYDLDPDRYRLSRIGTYDSANVALSQYVYTYWPDGDVKSINYDEFTYDELGRLSGATLK